MKFRSEVKIKRGTNLRLICKQKEATVDEEDYYIVELIEEGITADDELIARVGRKYNEDEVSAKLRLAQFVEDYSVFLAEGEKSGVFG